MKVTLSEHDPLIITVKGEKETVEYYGQDYLDEYGIEVPADLIERHKKACDEFWAIQSEIRSIKDAHWK